MNYWGEAAALGTAVSWALTSILFSFAGQRIGSVVVNRSRLLFAFLFLLITHWFLQGSFFPTEVEPFRWFWLTVSAILGLVLGDGFLFQAFVLIGARLSALLMSTVPIISVLVGWLLFGEGLTAVEMTAVLLSVGGVAWVVTEKQPGRTAVENKNYRLGLLFGLLGAVGQVVNLVTARYGMVGDYPAISATIIRIFVAMLVMWGAAVFQRQVQITFQHWRDQPALRTLIGGSFVGPFLGIWLSLIAVQLTRLGIAATLMALTPILLIPAEYAIYRKPISRRSLMGTMLAFAGVALIFLPQGS
ncbi:MAG: DMT family transporter [Chloroflexi bacterium]|nr:DMT family transporter [Chloroflexota bacterium]